MSELVFERGLFATLAAALIVPELTTFLIFLFVLAGLSGFLARQAWSVVRGALADQPATVPPVSGPTNPATFRIVSGPSLPSAE